MPPCDDIIRHGKATSVVVEVSSRESVSALARRAASLGEIRSVVHTAGVSPLQAKVSTVLAVDLLGVALVVEEFGQVVAPGGAGVVIASSGAYRWPAFTDEQALRLATIPADELLGLPIADPGTFPNSGAAYAFAKRANLVRVQAASVTWGTRDARINSISPGVIATAVEFLLSPAAGFISGTDLLVDGGATAAIKTGHGR